MSQFTYGNFAEFVSRQSLRMGVELPVPPSKLREYLQDLKTRQFARSVDNVTDSGKANWDVFDFCNRFLQTSEALEDAVKDLCDRMAAHNVRYAEIRFCPELHTREGLTDEQAIEAATKG